LDVEGEVTVGFSAGAFDGRLSKKLPPLKGGGDVACGPEGAAFDGTELVRPPKAEKAEDGCAGGDIAVVVLEKLIPPKASASPPNASCFASGGDVIAPKDGSRVCCGWAAG